MQGIFERFAGFANPTMQYWGLPIDYTAYETQVVRDGSGHLNVLNKSIIDDAVFIFSLLWMLDNTRCARRRQDVRCGSTV